MTRAMRTVGFAFVLLLMSCASQELHREGVVDIDNGRVEEGLKKLEQAVVDNPDNLAYRYDLQARRQAVAQMLFAAGDRARAAGNLEEAENYFRRLLAVDPNNEPARRGIDMVEAYRRHVAEIAAAQQEFDAGHLDEADVKVRDILAEDPNFTQASQLKAKIEAVWEPPGVAQRLHTGAKTPVTLEFRDAPTKMVFEVLSRQTGVNFIFDKDVRSDAKTSIFVRNVPVEQAVELVLGQSQLARQVLSPNMILIYPNTPAKQKEYQDQIVKTLYLTNTDAKRVQEMLKTVLTVKTLFVDDKANIVVIRDTPEVVRMAEKLVASLDMVVPEVMMEVEILEVNRSLMDDLGITYPTTATMAMTPITGRTFTLQDFADQNKSTITFTPPPAITINMMKQASTTNTLASPRIRARNLEKAKIMIGSRVPVITQSVTPTAGTAVTTGSVQYLDVGLQLGVQPDVHADGVVAITVDLQVSNILKEVRVVSSGTLAYEIGTRDASTVLSLKDGDTAILGGLISDQDTRNAATVPGLGDIPILGRLFGDHSSNKGKSEIIMSITPRIIRASTRGSSSDTEFWYGTESNMRSAPLASQTSPPSTGTPTVTPPPPSEPAGGAILYPPAEIPAPAAGTTPYSGADARPTAGGAGAGASASARPAPLTDSSVGGASGETSADDIEPVVANGTAPNTTVPSYGPASLAATPVAPPAATVVSASSGAASLSWDGPTSVQAGQEFSVVLTLTSDEGLVRVRSQARYNPSVLRLDSAEVGGVVPAALQAASQPQINARVGNVQMMIATSSDAPVQGTGDLMVLHFTALTASKTTPISLQFAATGADGHDAGVVAPRPLAVAINP
jgi:general secretion pathway protein D